MEQKVKLKMKQKIKFSEIKCLEKRIMKQDKQKK